MTTEQHALMPHTPPNATNKTKIHRTTTFYTEQLFCTADLTQRAH